MPGGKEEKGASLAAPFLHRALEAGLGACCAALLAAMTGLTVIDVIGRYFLNAPAPGAFELTQLMLAALIFAALPLTTAAGEHVEVDVVYGIAPRFWQRFMRVLGAVVSIIALWAMAWRLGVHADRLIEDGATTNALSLPLGPVGWFGAVMAALSGILVLLRLFRQEGEGDRR